MRARGGGYLGLGAVCLGLVVGRLCVGLLTGLVVRGDVGPVGRREAVDVVDGLGGYTPLACSCRPPGTPVSRLSPPLFPTSALLLPVLYIYWYDTGIWWLFDSFLSGMVW